MEKRTGKTVITDNNAAQLQDLVTGLIETCIREDIESKRVKLEASMGL